MDGFLDGVEHGVIRGWAWNSKNEGQVYIEIKVDGNLIARELCQNYRPDLEEAGIGHGRYAFEVDIKDALKEKLNGNLRLSVEIPELEVALTPPNYRFYNSYSRLDRDIQKRVSSAIRQEPTKLTRRSPYKIEKCSKQHLDISVASCAEDVRELFIFAPLINWDIDLFQRPQQLALAMAKAGHCVIYVTPNWPKIEFDGIGYINGLEKLFITNDWEYVKQHFIGNVVVASTSSLTIEEMRLLKQRGHNVIYDYIDHISPEISGAGARSMLERHYNLGYDAVSSVVASADLLFNEISLRYPSQITHLSKNGVDVGHYKDIVALNQIVKNIKARGKKIVGYFGAIAPWLDIDLLNNVFSCDEYEFVIIGPDYDGSSLRRMERRENVTLTGSVSYWELPSLAGCFDVAVIPFKPGDVARSTSPLKLYEYFAIGVPVVVERDMAECTPYYGVLSYRGSSEFLEKIALAIKDYSSEEAKRLIRNNAESNSWENRIKAFEDAAKSGRLFSKELNNSQRIDSRLMNARAYSVAEPDRFVSLFAGFNNHEAVGRIMEEACAVGDVLELSIVLPEMSSSGAFRMTVELPEKQNSLCPASVQINIDEKLVGWSMLPETKTKVDFLFPGSIYENKRLRISIVFEEPVIDSGAQKLCLSITHLSFVSNSRVSASSETSGLFGRLLQIEQQ